MAGQFGHARLHAEGQLVLLDAGVRFRVADELAIIHLVERFQAVQRLPAHFGGTPAGLLMYRIGSPPQRNETPACSPDR